MTMMRTLLLFLSWTRSRSVWVVNSHNIFTSSFSVIPCCWAMFVPLATIWEIINFTKFPMNNPGQYICRAHCCNLFGQACYGHILCDTLLAFSTHSARCLLALMFDVCLITFVLNAWSCTAAIRLSVSSLRSDLPLSASSRIHYQPPLLSAVSYLCVFPWLVLQTFLVLSSLIVIRMFHFSPVSPSPCSL